MRLTWLVGMALLLAGCVGNTARQAVDRRPGPTFRSVADNVPAPQAIQQMGQANLAAQAAVEAPGWKGLEYTTAVPVGQVVLLALMLWFSHRREVMRIKQNGRPRVAPGPRELPT